MEQDCKFENYIVETHKAVYGNGHPEHGLLWMVKGNTDFINMLKKIFWPALIAAMLGSGAAVANLLVNTFLHLNK